MTWNKKALADWYDQYASNNDMPDDQIVSVASARYKLIAKDIEQLISLMDFSGSDRVLDAGCGAGRFLYRISKVNSSQLFGIDTSRKMIKRAKKRTPDAEYVVADVTHLPFRTGVFTAVICYSVLWHIPSERGRYFNTDVYETGLREFKRALARNGRLLFNISNPFRLQYIIGFVVSLASDQLSKNAKLQTYKIYIGKAKNILTELGFRISEVVAGGFYPIHLEIFYDLFHRQPSEGMINSYYDSFDRLGEFPWAKLFLPPDTFVIKAVK